jgi:hypothetical protein
MRSADGVFTAPLRGWGLRAEEGPRIQLVRLCGVPNEKAPAEGWPGESKLSPPNYCSGGSNVSSFLGVRIFKSRQHNVVRVAQLLRTHYFVAQIL